jgi:hypothetical protein
MVKGYFAVMRDTLVLEKLCPYKNEREEGAARIEATQCLLHNRRCYQGNFTLSHVRDVDAADHLLRPYMQTLVTQEETIKRTGDWIPTPVH